ncbi:MAG: hypothetical protein ACE1ZA_19955, partial [Pseudomonadales bacterium]
DEIGTMDFEDLEDLQVVDPQPVTVQVELGSETFDFDVVTDVQYVKKQGNNFVLWQSATDLQKMTVTVSSLTELELLTPTITVSRIYSQSSN